LTGRETQALCPEPTQIVGGCHGSHELDPTTTRGKGKWPDGIFAGETHHFVKGCGKKALSHMTFRHGSLIDAPVCGAFGVDIESDRTCHNFLFVCLT
jgi:hypothetical protein